MSCVLGCPWQRCALISKRRRDVHVTQKFWPFSNYFPPALLAGGWGCLGEWGQHLAGGRWRRQFACVGHSSCLPPAITNRHWEPCTPSCPSPSHLPAWITPAFASCSRYFPLPHHCTKAGQMCAASRISNNTSGTGSLHIFIFGPLILVPCAVWNGWRNVQRW